MHTLLRHLRDEIERAVAYLFDHLACILLTAFLGVIIGAMIKWPPQCVLQHETEIRSKWPPGHA